MTSRMDIWRAAKLLVDGRTGKKVGDAASTQTIQAGGLYSIEAGDYIVNRCADSVADGLKDKLAAQKPGS